MDRDYLSKKERIKKNRRSFIVNNETTMLPYYMNKHNTLLKKHDSSALSNGNLRSHFHLREPGSHTEREKYERIIRKRFGVVIYIFVFLMLV